MNVDVAETATHERAAFDELQCLRRGGHRTRGEHLEKREDFIAAVTGHPESADAVDAVVATRLGSMRPGVASV